jgi:putative hydrolase of the HAD superfamily
VLARLEGRKFIFTNGSKEHAERVAAKLGIAPAFDGIFDIAACGYVPKPKAEAFRGFLAFCGGDVREAAMFDDLPHNLETAHALGLTTVLVQSSFIDHPSQRALAELGHRPDYIDFETGDLPDFLNGIVVSLASD